MALNNTIDSTPDLGLNLSNNIGGRGLLLQYVRGLDKSTDLIPSIGDNILPILISNVTRQIHVYREAVIEAEKATRTAQLGALSAIYAVHLWLLENSTTKSEFFSDNGLVVHPRSKYPAQPLVKHFVSVGDPCPELQTKTSYWAGAIEAGIINGIPVEDFEQFIRDTKGGVHGAYLMAVKASVGKQPRGDRIDKFVTAHNE